MRYSTNNKLLVNSGEHVNVITQIIVKANKVFVDHTSLAYIHTASFWISYVRRWRRLCFIWSWLSVYYSLCAY